MIRQLFASAVFLAIVAPSIGWAQAPDPAANRPILAGEGLRAYDIRLDDAATVARIKIMKKSGVFARRQAAAKNVILRTPGAAVELNDALATPEFVRSTRSFLTPVAAAPIDAKAVIKSYVSAHADLFGVTPAQLDGARVSRDATTAHNGVRTIWLQQEINGVPVLGADLRANVLPDGRLASIGSRMLPIETIDLARNKPRKISPEQAAKLAAANIGVQLAGPLNVVARMDNAAQRIVFARTPELGRNITADRVYFPVAFDDVRPAIRVIVNAADDSNVYEVIVDAGDGSILQRANDTWYGGVGGGGATYRVWTSDSPAPMSPGPDTPDGTQAPIVPRELLTLESVDPAASPNGWIFTGLNETLGNNIDAHTDIDANNIPDLPRPMGSPFRVFDFPIDLNSSPSTYRNGSVVQGFYTANVYHDRIYGLGFTEQFGNFQNDNFGNGGVGGDSISLDVQDGQGFNNANFGGSGSDGSSARIQMFLFNGPTPDRDGNLDAHILLHELTHGTSIRLHGGIGGEQGGGMGEGWSDFYALAMLSEPGDDPAGVYALSGFATFDISGTGFNNNYYFGIRRYPYSTDLTKSPLTYADIDNAQFSVDPSIPRNPFIGSSNASEVHNVGEIWCAALWECRANLVSNLGFDGNQTTLQLVTDGMKLTTTSSPNMVQSRDAILLADLIDNNGDNVCDLWTGFAKRGLGGDAVSPSSSDSGVVESFTVPVGVNFAIDGGAPDRALAGEITSFPVAITNNCGAPLLPGTPRLVISINGANAQEIPLDPGADASQFIANIPALNCGDQVSYYLAADTDDGVFTFPPDAPTQTISLFVFTDIQLSFSDDFEQDLGWTVSGNASTGQWQRGVPIGGGTRGDPPTDADGSGQAYVTQNAPGDTDVDNGATILTSPTLDASGAGDAFLSYYLWYTNDTGSSVDDVMTVEISGDDGVSWTTLEQLPVDTDGWELRMFKIADFITPTSAMRIRFTASDFGGGSIVEAGVDGVSIQIIVCDASATSDLNGDGVVDGSDLAALLNQWGPCPPLLGVCPADLNGDGTVDGSDLAELLADWGTV